MYKQTPLQTSPRSGERLWKPPSLVGKGAGGLGFWRLSVSSNTFKTSSYREWVKSRKHDCNFVEQPWLGASQFYVGLQLADYVAYLISLKTQDIQKDDRNFEFLKAFDILKDKIHLVEIPEN